MTDDQISAWKVERDMARAIENEADRNKALQTAYDHRDEMMMTCIAHQSGRVKEQGKQIEDIMQHHNAMVQSHKTFQAMLAQEKCEKEMYKKILAVVKWIAALGGGGGIGAAIMKVLGGC
jgi:uncharacterized protein YfbU (UPF0304 family)